MLKFLQYKKVEVYLTNKLKQLIMYYFQFKRTNLGNLAFIGKYNDKYNLQFNNGGVWYSENEIENIKDNFLVANQRVVKNGKTWLKNHNLKKTPSYFY